MIMAFQNAFNIACLGIYRVLKKDDFGLLHIMHSAS